MQGVEEWIGIDGCKRWLDVHVRPQNKSFWVNNNASGSMSPLRPQPKSLFQA